METPVLKDRRFAGGKSVLCLGRTLPLQAMYLSGPLLRQSSEILQTLGVCAGLRLRQLSTVTWLVVDSVPFTRCVKGSGEGSSAVEKHECPRLGCQSQMNLTEVLCCAEGEATDLEGDKSSGLW